MTQSDDLVTVQVRVMHACVVVIGDHGDGAHMHTWYRPVEGLVKPLLGR